MHYAVAVSISIAYSFACLCFGVFLLRLINKKSLAADSLLNSIGTSFLLGQGILSLFFQIIAVLKLLTLAVVVGTLIIMTLSGIVFTLPLLSNLFKRPLSIKNWWRQEQSTGIKVLLLLLLFYLARQVLMAMLPPTPRGDSIAFYLALPKTIAAFNQLSPLPGYESFTSVGLEAEFHFAALMILHSTTAAKLFSIPTGLAAAGMLVLLAQSCQIKRRGQIIVLVMLFTSDTFTSTMGDGKVDVWGAAMGLAAYYWALRLGAEKSARPAILTGLFSGLAILAKVSYLAFMPPTILLLVVWQHVLDTQGKPLFSKESLQQFFRISVIAGVCVLLPLLVHVFKNTVLLDEPLAPLISSNPNVTFIRDQSWFNPEDTRRFVGLLPFTVIFGTFSAMVTPLYLALAPLVLLIPRQPLSQLKRSPLFQITIAAIAAIVIWTIYRPSVIAPRYTMAPLLLLTLVGARGADYVLETEKWRKPLGSYVLGAVFIAFMTGFSTQFAYIGITANDAVRIFTDDFHECDIERKSSLRDSSCRVAEVLNKEAAPGERVLLNTFYRYWLRPDLIQCSSGDTSIGKSPYENEYINSLGYVYDEGFRYIITDSVISTQSSQKLFASIPDWLRIETLYEDKVFHLYKLVPSDPNRQSRLTCQQVDPPMWSLVVNENYTYIPDPKIIYDTSNYRAYEDSYHGLINLYRIVEGSGVFVAQFNASTLTEDGYIFTADDGWTAKIQLEDDGYYRVILQNPDGKIIDDGFRFKPGN